MTRRSSSALILAIGPLVGLSACCQTKVAGADLNDSGQGPRDCASAGGTCVSGSAIACAGTILTAYDCSAGQQVPTAICCLEPPPLDAGIDAGLDAGSDGGSDAGPDAGQDAGQDAGFDAGSDAGPKPACPPVLDAGLCIPGRASDLSITAAYPGTLFAQLISADLNGDGLLDLIAIQDSAFKVGFVVFFGQADGGLRGPVSYDGPSATVGAVGDLNHDGVPDVVVSDYPGVDVFLNDGSGGLAKETSILTTNPEVTSIAIGDLDADGFGDVVLEEGSFAEVFFGGASGTFSAAVPLTQLGANSAAQQQILVADLNEDGLADIVGIVPASDPNQLGAQIAVLLNQGGGNFQMTSYPASFSAFGLLPRPFKAPDILLVARGYESYSEAQVLENTCAGSFRLGRAYEIVVNYEGNDVPFAVGDFNGDCLPDIAVTDGYCDPSGGGTITILYGDGTGGFGPPQAVQPTGGGPNLLAPLGPVGSPRALAVSNVCSGGFTVYGDASR